MHNNKEPLYIKQKPKFHLTQDDLDMFEKHAVIFSEFGFIKHPWFNDAKSTDDGGSLANDGQSTLVKFVVTTGGIGDWAIYHSLDANIEHSDYLDGTGHLSATEAVIFRGGAKVHDEQTIRALVECSDEVFSKYRH